MSSAPEGSPPPIAVVREFLGPVLGSGPVDLAETIPTEPVMVVARRLIAPGAPVRFPTPDGGFVGAMAGPFEGFDGYMEGWGEWLSLWEGFTLTSTELLESPPDRVLLLAESVGRMRETGMEVPQKVAALYTVRDGRIVLIDHFLDQDQARAVAGLA